MEILTEQGISLPRFALQTLHNRASPVERGLSVVREYLRAGVAFLPKRRKLTNVSAAWRENAVPAYYLRSRSAFDISAENIAQIVNLEVDCSIGSLDRARTARC